MKGVDLSQLYRKTMLVGVLSVLCLAGCQGSAGLRSGVAHAPSVNVDPPVSAALTGEQLWVACSGCHVLDPAQGHAVGPNLGAVLGRQAGTAEGFAYSPALTASEIVWDRGALTAWVLATEAMLPGTWMLYHNLLQPQEVNTLVEHIIQINQAHADG